MLKFVSKYAEEEKEVSIRLSMIWDKISNEYTDFLLDLQDNQNWQLFKIPKDYDGTERYCLFHPSIIVPEYFGLDSNYIELLKWKKFYEFIKESNKFVEFSCKDFDYMKTARFAKSLNSKMNKETVCDHQTSF
jgi:hypothetical protein